MKHLLMSVVMIVVHASPVLADWTIVSGGADRFDTPVLRMTATSLVEPYTEIALKCGAEFLSSEPGKYKWSSVEQGAELSFDFYRGKLENFAEEDLSPFIAFRRADKTVEEGWHTFEFVGGAQRARSRFLSTYLDFAYKLATATEPFTVELTIASDFGERTEAKFNVIVPLEGAGKVGETFLKECYDLPVVEPGFSFDTWKLPTPNPMVDRARQEVQERFVFEYRFAPNSMDNKSPEAEAWWGRYSFYQKGRATAVTNSCDATELPYSVRELGSDLAGGFDPKTDQENHRQLAGQIDGQAEINAGVSCREIVTDIMRNTGLRTHPHKAVPAPELAVSEANYDPAANLP